MRISRQSLLVELALDDGAVAAHLAQPHRHDGAAPGVVLEELQKADDLRFPAHGQLGQGQLLKPLQAGLGRDWCRDVLGAAQLARDIPGAAPLSFEARGQALRAVVGHGLARDGTLARKGLLLEATHGTQFWRLGGFAAFQGNAAHRSARGETFPAWWRARIQRGSGTLARGQRIAGNGLPFGRQGQEQHRSVRKQGPHGLGS